MKAMLNLLGTLLVTLTMIAIPASADKGNGEKTAADEKGKGKGDGEKPAVFEKTKGKGEFDKANLKEKAAGKGDGEKAVVSEKGKGKGDGDKAPGFEKGKDKGGGDKFDFKEKGGGKGDGEKKGFNEKGGGKGDGDKSGLNKQGDPADHAWADFLRAAKRTAAAGAYPQITLTSGSVLAGAIESLDASRLALQFGGGTRSFSTLQVSSVAFDWLRPELAGQLQAGRPGVLLATGDFVDGEIRSLVAGRVTVNSVLFGIRDYAVPGEALAMTVGKVVPGTAEFTVRLRNGSRLLARSLGAQDQQLVVEESVAGRLAVALEDMVEVYRTPAAEAAR